jgi:GNAT superfamily N-acetyltransferase
MTMSYALRTACADDADAVGRLLQATYPVLFPERYDAAVLAFALPLMTRANPRLLTSGTYYVAELAAGDLVGCGGWSMEPPEGGAALPDVGHVRHFATHPRWLRRGIGRAILSRCLRDARERGVRRLDCCSSLVAEGFYRAMGFATLGSFAIEVAEGVVFPAVLMRRDLTL